MGIWDFIQDEILGMKWLNRLIGSLQNACGLDSDEKVVSVDRVLKPAEISAMINDMTDKSGCK